MKKITVFIAIILMLSLIMIPGCAKKENYPTKPIQVIAPYSAGGGVDTVARAVGKSLKLEKPFVVTNLAGGGGKIGTMEVVGAKPDGYTILLHSVTAVASGYHAGLYDTQIWKELKPVAAVTTQAGAITVKSNSPFKNIQELVDYAKANPGKVSVGVSGAGGGAHIIVAAFANAVGIELNIVPFAGAADARAALEGGHVDMTGAFISEVYDFVKAGNFRLLATTGASREADLPDVPTFKESGIDFILNHRNGFFAPKDTPDEVIKILEDALKNVTQDQEFISTMKGMLTKAEYLNSADFTKELESLDKMIAPIGEMIKPS